MLQKEKKVKNEEISDGISESLIVKLLWYANSSK